MMEYWLLGRVALMGNSAARALIKNTSMNAEEVALESLNIAAEICIYTNHNIVLEKKLKYNGIKF